MKPKKQVNKKVLIAAILFMILVTATLVFITVKFSGPEEENPSHVTTVQGAGLNDPGSTLTPEEETDEGTEPVEEDMPAANDEETGTMQDGPAAESGTEPQDPPTETAGNGQEEESGITAEQIWNGMANSMGDSLTANLSLSEENLESLYGINPSICEEFVLRKAGTVVSPEEYLIVKATGSNLATIEQACQQRQAALASQWSEYRDFAPVVENYQILRSGEYLFFGISSNIDQMAGIFQGIMMSQS